MSIKVIRRPEPVIRLRVMARGTDPETSKQAAQRIREEVKGQARQALYSLLRSASLTDEEMWDRYEMLLIQGLVPKITDARLRHCRLDLVEQGLVVRTKERRTNRSGTQAFVWSVT